MLKKLIPCITFFFICCNNYATEYKLTDNICIMSDIKNDLLLVYKSDCKKEKYLLDTFQVPNDIPKIDFVFQEEISNKKNIFFSISYSDSYRDVNNKTNYADTYHLNYVYQCETQCKFNKKISNFFGNGGDLINIYTNKIIYKFPYSSEKSIKNELKSSLFKKWIYNKKIQGKVIKKTYINENSQFSFSHLGYLIKNDEFTVKDISSKWLNISYTNKNGNKITGWIACNDTNICNN